MKVFWSSPLQQNPILYQEPISLIKTVAKNRNKNNTDPSFFECPAFKKFAKNTFVFFSPVNCEYEIINNEINSKLPSSLNFHIRRMPSIENNLLVEIEMPFNLFTKKSTEVVLMPPFFHANNYLNSGSIVPGEYDISKWYRSMVLEFNLWPNTKVLKINEGDPICYIHINTNKNVKMVRFFENYDIAKISQHCSTAGGWDPHAPMEKRYSIFSKSKVKKLIEKEIKNNVVN